MVFFLESVITSRWHPKRRVINIIKLLLELMNQWIKIIRKLIKIIKLIVKFNINEIMFRYGKFRDST